MKKDMSFESAMERLEEIVSKLESGNESLEASLKLFEEGSALASLCYGRLHKAEQKIKQITEFEETDGDQNA